MSYCTAAEVKLYLDITGDSDDALISALISRAQKFIDNYTGRTFEGSASSRTFDAIEDVDGRYLLLDIDLCNVTSITNGDSTTVTSSQYVTEPRNEAPYYAIKLKENAGVDWTYSATPEDAITVNGIWAYSTTAPDDIKHACIRMAAYFYRQKDTGFESVAAPEMGIITTPQGMPKDVRLILDPYRRLI